MISDTLTTVQLTDSLTVYKAKVNLLESKLIKIEGNLDSIIQVNSELNTSKNYFSDIIDNQMDWFAIIFAITFGVLGLLYWFGILKYFQAKFKQSNQAFEDFKDLETVNNARLNDKISSVNSKVDTLSESLKSTIDDKIQNAFQKVEALSAEIDLKIKQNSEVLTSQINKQKKDFDTDKENLLSKINDINFDAMRGMFFTNYNKENFFPAITWSIPIILNLVRQEDEEELNDWINNTKICIENMKYDASMVDRIEDLNEALKEIKSLLAKEDQKKIIDFIINNFNRIYYSHVGDDKKNDKT